MAFNIPKPNASNIPTIPLESSVPEDKQFHFSLCYWREMDFFGIRDQGSSWFSALFSHLKSLGNLRISELMSDPQLRLKYRFHQINWCSKNIPIQQSDLENLPAYVFSEETDFYQFQLSKGSGRVVGFFDYQHVFQIVLFDPKHNLQPSKNFNYSVDKTRVSVTHYETLLTQLNSFMAQFQKIDCKKICQPIVELQKWIGEEYGIVSYLPILDIEQGILDKFMELYGVKSVGEVIDYLLELAVKEVEGIN